MATTIRWLEVKDYLLMLQLEGLANSPAWNADEFKHYCGSQWRGIVAIRNNFVIGYLVFTIHKDKFGHATDLQIIRMATHPEYQMSGVGTLMLQHLKGLFQIHPTQPKRIVIVIPPPSRPYILSWLFNRGFIEHDVHFIDNQAYRCLAYLRPPERKEHDHSQEEESC